MPVNIGPLSADQIGELRPALAALLQDAVESGASIGFLPPLPAAEAEAYDEA